MRKSIENAGFRSPARRVARAAELVAGAALVLSTLIVATVLSVGVAHAGVVDGVIGHEGSLFGIALLLGLIFIGLGGFVLPEDRHKEN